MSNDKMTDFVDDIKHRLGSENITIDEGVLTRYGAHTLPGPDRPPSAIVYPGSTADVQTIVRAANIHGIPIFPISTGSNLGLGTRAPVQTGQVVVDLGKRMNRILEIDETLAYAAVQPGVSFQMMADELVRRGGNFIISHYIWSTARWHARQRSR